MNRKVHPNSVAAYRSISDERGTRANAIYTLLLVTGRLMTDRHLMEALGFRERNATAPRVTELIDNCWLVEVDSIECPVTGKTVRRVKALTPEQRAPLAAARRAAWKAARPSRTTQEELSLC